MTFHRRKALFLDRDGVINISPSPEQYYIRSRHEFFLRPGITELICRARAMGYLIVVVTNQRAVHLGHLSPADLDDIHTYMKTLLAAEGATIDAVYACIHGIHEACACRKPKPGMLLQAADELGINLQESIMVGDSMTDIQAGASVGCATHLVTL